MSDTLKGFKGFDKDLKCNGFQFEVGKQVEHDGEVRLCASGFHFAEAPMDVFCYYPPGTSRFAEVEAGGVSPGKENDSKRVAKVLTVKAELSIHAFIEAAVSFVLKKVGMATVHERAKGAASNSGKAGAASNSGEAGAASNSGPPGAASNSGDAGDASD